MSKLLTAEQIEEIVSFVPINEHIPIDVSLGVVNQVKTNMRKQLKDIKVHPSLIPRLKSELERIYFESLVNPGESVGIISAQSIGEKNTQSTLNTFHKAGLAEKSVTTGVPRLKQLLNATTTPKLVSYHIHFQEGNTNIQETRNTVSSQFIALTIKDISKRISICMDKQDEIWYKPFEILHNSDFKQCNGVCISLELNSDKLFMYKMSPKDIAEKIEDQFSDYHCVFSPMTYCQVDVFISADKIKIPKERVGYITTDNAVEICLEEVVQKNIEELYVCGIIGIDEGFYEKNEGVWFLETQGKYSKKTDTYLDILAHPKVDSKLTLSNNIWDIFTVLGIEATRLYLISEFLTIMDGVNNCHPTLLANRMTFSGTVESVSRYTMRKEPQVLLRASFEETMDNFISASFFSEKDDTKGMSASMICGKPPTLGTTFFSVEMDLDNLPDEDLADEEEISELSDWEPY
jgi:DNA-directed RNA polymerase beta' subunit